MKTEEYNESQIRQLMEDWAKAVRDNDLPAILAHHDDHVVMYDVPEPFQSVGLEAYRKTWDTFYAWVQNLGIFDIQELHITAGEEVAFCFAAMRCAGISPAGEKEMLHFRLTAGLKKINDQWTILHEHHSIPAA